MGYLLDHNNVDRDYNTSHIKVSDCMCGVLSAFYKLTFLLFLCFYESGAHGHSIL